jgi:hypothetical protein
LAAAPDAIVTTTSPEGSVSIAGACASLTARIRPRSRFTSITARWPACGSSANVRLQGKILALDCNRFTGRLKEKGSRWQRFTAQRSACGDGTLDAGGGEQCEPGGPACPGGGTCRSCDCVTTTTTTEVG